jgi:hypothetical protein
MQADFRTTISALVTESFRELEDPNGNTHGDSYLSFSETQRFEDALKICPEGEPR